MFVIKKTLRSEASRSKPGLNVVLVKTLSLAWLLTAVVNTAFGQLVWSEEFNTGTALDTAIWSYDLGASGWGNQELQEYTNSPENVRIENGNLVITVRETVNGNNQRHFTSARVRTEDKLKFMYGTIEARIKVPDLADGLWPAFWTLGNNFRDVGWPYCGELDVMEMGNSSAITDGKINRRVGSAAHWDSDGSWASYARSRDMDTDLNDGFHIFSMDWTPTDITTYIDGNQIWTFRNDINACPSCTEFHQPHFIILNMAVGGTYTGLLNADDITATMPAELLVDYVRIYDNGFTELSGSSVYTGPGPEYSGSWYNADQSGHGFSIAIGERADGTPLAVVHWYIYDDAGNPIFLVGTGTPNNGRLEVRLTSPVGMVYGEFDPDSLPSPLDDGGTLVFEFSDPDNATYSYTPSDFTINAWGHEAIESTPLVKLFGIPVSVPEDTVE